MHVHLIGVSGTGMGSLAMLFRQAGHAVSGSDGAFDPPMGPALQESGVTCVVGFDAAHLSPAPDLVIVGNVIRSDNAEAVAAASMKLPSVSMSAALREHFLVGRRPLIVAGTHGKTTTCAMSAWLLSCAGLEPGYFIGGLPKNLPSGAAIGRANKKSLLKPNAAAPFVVEGDEYDAVYWHKQPKFLDYVGIGTDDVAILTSVEHDHIDIYPSSAAYDAAFAGFVRAVPEGGLIVCDARNQHAVGIVNANARARTVFYALDGDDTGDLTPTWLGAMSTIDAAGLQQFDLFAGGVSCGRYMMPVPGAHNVRNAVASIAACAEGFGASVAGFKSALCTFKGVGRRQDLLGEPRGIRVYDDFAHHPTAVDETLRALRSKHPRGALWAIFEPRSATAVRNLHQEAYVAAFKMADRVVLAPLGRANVPEAERLDLGKLAKDLGPKASLSAGVEAILVRVTKEARPGDTVAILSNGAFGGLHQKLLHALEQPEAMP